MILTTCKYFDLVGNRCNRVTDGKCNDLQDCEFKYIAELKAENDKLREDYIKLSQQKDLDNVRWQKRCTDLHIEDKAKADKYWLVLQEIKAVAEQSNVDCIYRISVIRKILTKAEEE